MEQATIVSERIDELPILIYCLKQMQVDTIINSNLKTPHGHWEGLSYGEVALVFVAYVVMTCTHFLSPMEEWAKQHQASLSQAMGKAVRAEDFTDDRLAIVLKELGREQTRPGEQIQRELGQRIIRAYELPVDIGRIDMTSVSVYHQPPADNPGLMRYGHSKDHRPDKRQFKVVLGTLDPVGMPLATAVISGEQSDDPHYIPTWDRMVATLERSDFLVVGDCKMGSLETRAHIQDHDGFYLMPLPMTGKTPENLRTWVLDPPCPPQAIRLPSQSTDQPPVGQGFEIAVACRWEGPKPPPDDPTPQKIVEWTERRLVIQSEVHAGKQRAGLQERLAKAEEGLIALNTRPTAERTVIESRALTIVNRYGVADYLSLTFIDQVTVETRLVGPGRPGPRRSTGTIENHSWTVAVARRADAIDQFNRLAGWRIFATNTSGNRLDLAGAVNCYRQEWQPEHGFYRLKGGMLALAPLYIRDNERIAGLLLLLDIALRLLTLIEFVVRRDLDSTNESLKGLYAGNSNHATRRPSAERLLKAFDNITLYRLETPTVTRYEVTPLSPLQRRILQGLSIPESIYAPPTTPLVDLVLLSHSGPMESRNIRDHHLPSPAISPLRTGTYIPPPLAPPFFDTG